MANPWEKDDPVAVPAPWEHDAPDTSAVAEQPYESQILPLTRVPAGQGNFGMSEHKIAVPGILKDLYNTAIEGGEAARGMRPPEGPARDAAMLAVGAGAPGVAAARVAPRVVGEVAEAAAPVARELAATPAALMQRAKPQAVAPLAEGELATQQALGDNAASLATQSPTAKKAEDLLYQNLLDSGWTPQKIQERLKWLGPGGTLADLEPFSGRAMASAQFPKGQKNAQRVLGSRARGAEQRLLKTVDNTLSDENYYEALDHLRAARSAEAQPLRQTAMSNALGKPIKSDMIQRLQKDSPYFNQAMSEGKKIAKEEAAREGIEIPTTESWFHGESFDDPNIKTLHEPTLRMLDAAKQGYQALLKPYRNPYTGIIDKADPTAVELSKTVQSLTDTLRSASPEYAKYLDSWSEHSQQLDALARGRKILEHDPEITMKVLRNATPNELLDTQSGLARAMKDKIRDNPQSAVRLFQKGATLDKIRAVFPGKQEFRALHRQVLREAQKQKTANRNLAGSQSIERKLGAEGIEQEASSVPAEVAGAAMDVATKNPIGLTRRAGRLIDRFRGQKADELGPEVAGEISSVLHNADPIAQERMIQRFKQRSMPTMQPQFADDLP